MNKLIIWDKNNFLGEDDRFYTISEFIEASGGHVDFAYDKEGILKAIFTPDDGEYTSRSFVEFKAFKNIGKADIFGKNIYADCSIVEFEYNDIDPKNKQTIRGYFSYESDTLSYVLNHGDEEGRCFVSLIALSKFKVIGTLQESPELLEQSK